MPLQHRADFTVPVLLLTLLIVSTALVRAAVGTTAQVSVSSTGQGGNELSRDATISGDGRFVVLERGRMARRGRCQRVERVTGGVY